VRGRGKITIDELAKEVGDLVIWSMREATTDPLAAKLERLREKYPDMYLGYWKHNIHGNHLEEVKNV